MKIICLMVFGYFLVACSLVKVRQVSSTNSIRDILLTEKVPTEKVAAISQENLRLDINRLIFTLENAYPGKDLLSGNSYANLIDDLGRIQESKSNLSSEQFCERLASAFHRVNDFHLTANINNVICGRTWPKGNVGQNSGAVEVNRTWSVLSKTHKNINISVLSLRTMSPDSSVEWDGFLLKVRELVEAKKSFIIDLRGNGGGSTTNAFQLSRLLYGLSEKEEIPWPEKEVIRILTPTAYALTANYYWLTLQQFESKGQIPPTYLQNNYQEFSKLSHSAQQVREKAVQVTKLGQIPVNLKKAIQFPVYILIDQGCGSTCELVVESLEKLPFVHTVGERTTGVVQYGFTGWLYLPGSRITVHIPTQGNRYFDHRQIEKIGYLPQSFVPSGSDALEYTLNNLL